MAGPRKLWKTTIVVWTKEKPEKASMAIWQAEAGIAGAMTKFESELISSPYAQTDGPPEAMFSEDSIVEDQEES